MWVPKFSRLSQINQRFQVLNYIFQDLPQGTDEDPIFIDGCDQVFADKVERCCLYYRNVPATVALQLDNIKSEGTPLFCSLTIYRWGVFKLSELVKSELESTDILNSSKRLSKMQNNCSSSLGSLSLTVQPTKDSKWGGLFKLSKNFQRICQSWFSKMIVQLHFI